VLEHPQLLSIIHSVRFVVSIGLLLLFAREAYAQRRGGIGGYFPVVGRPVFNPSQPVYSRPPALPPWALNPGARHPIGPREFGGATIVPYPVPYPVYSGGDYPESPDGEAGFQADTPSPPQARTIIIVMPPQAPSPESIVPNAPEPRQAIPSEDPAGPLSDPVRFFIALKDHWVYSAVAYWVQGQTLHYLTSHGSHNQVSLALVDRKITARLNAGSTVAFILPPQ
jgi:hypothetical protein